MDMKVLKKALKIIGWGVAALVGLGVAAYLIVVAVNWRDREPSVTALQFANEYRARPAVPDSDNGFIYLMGLGVPPGDSPFQMGLKRIAWLQDSSRRAHLDPASDPMGKSPVVVDDVHPAAIQKFIEACRFGGPACPGAFQDGNELFEQWQASESWALPRYLELIRYGSWHEPVPFNPEAPLPPYGLAVDGQMLLFLDAKTLSERGDYAGVRNLLEQDLGFWRRVLESADTLIGKMVATAAIDRNFKLGSLVLRQIPPEQVLSAMPAGWSVPISDSERSMRRSLIGEWMYVSGMLRQSSVVSAALADKSFASKLKVRLASPFYRQQDTVNKDAEYLLQMAELLNAPLDHYENAVNQTAALAQRTARESMPPHSVYNMMGQVLLAMGAYDFGRYARRVSDLEGVRRAAELAATLHSGKVAEGGAAVSASALREPYHNRPFEWARADKAVVFRGLEMSERGVHHLYY